MMTIVTILYYGWHTPSVCTYAHGITWYACHRPIGWPWFAHHWHSAAKWQQLQVQLWWLIHPMMLLRNRMKIVLHDWTWRSNSTIKALVRARSSSHLANYMAHYDCVLSLWHNSWWSATEDNPRLCGRKIGNDAAHLRASSRIIRLTVRFAMVAVVQAARIQLAERANTEDQAAKRK